jgi:ribonuclease T
MNIIVIDVETGGLDPQADALLAIGAVCLNVDGKIEGTFHTLVAPAAGLAVNPSALAVNGLTPSPAWPPEREALRAFANFCQRWAPALFAGCNVPFDRAFLSAAARRCSLPEPVGRHILDIKSLALALHVNGVLSLPIKRRMPSPSLDSILAALRLPGREGPHHDALTDAQLTASALWRLLECLPGPERGTVC